MSAAIPGARFVALDGIGHLANLEAPAPFEAALRGFSTRHAPEAR